jgi:2-polyprenyl-3-methyl-5-hydroxy-6-metoxy-1,4-benzoquinol methylase
MIARPPCPLCGDADGEVRYDLTPGESAEDVPGLVIRCRACAMWFKAVEDPDALPTDYPGEHGDDPLAARYLGGAAARAFFREILTEVRRARREPAPRLLDIGAGAAVLLEEAARLGFAAEGIDRSPANAAAARARGFAVAHAAAESLDLAERFDVVTMLDIIEHVLDPLDVLRRVHRALKPGGDLIVYTPNHRALVVELAKLLHAAGIRYPVRQLFGRNHVAFFDDRSLPRALRRAGFDLQALRRAPYDPARPGQEISPLNLLAIRAVEAVGRPFGRVFRLLAYARRPGRSAAQGQA